MVTRRVWFALALAAILPAGRPAAAQPAGPAAPAGPTSARTLDPAFARAVTSERPARHILRSIAVDLDRDGDMDVIAATVEEPIVIWIRDGSGRFTRQRPAGPGRMDAERGLTSPVGHTGVLGEAPASKWQSPADAVAHGVASAPAILRPRPGASSGPRTLAPFSDSSRGPPPHLVA